MIDELDSAKERAVTISKFVKSRINLDITSKINDLKFDRNEYGDLETLGISKDAWLYILSQDIEPELVFAHPTILMTMPQSSLDYRGISTLSLKRVQTLAYL